ncbi:LPS translocon maturation chaperone LptM [Hyphomicrobium sp.]|uniref:LPS translocon maturation chaperone LptM n=1 Tax=Hyphomicrobium sp. TaxID=82 RepID=UPI002D79AEDA|nr:lipoprotein [Hyphomicrobium sp.]HET6388334.1 lipoprotein [Hyphomicrobium sp.]
MAVLARRTKSWIALALAGAVCAGFGGCGVRGPLEPPPAAKAAGDVRAPEERAAGSNSDAAPKPHEPFILDPLLR